MFHILYESNLALKLLGQKRMTLYCIIIFFKYQFFSFWMSSSIANCGNQCLFRGPKGKQIENSSGRKGQHYNILNGKTTGKQLQWTHLATNKLDKAQLCLNVSLERTRLRLNWRANTEPSSTNIQEQFPSLPTQTSRFIDKWTCSKTINSSPIYTTCKRSVSVLFYLKFTLTGKEGTGVEPNRHDET